MYVYTADAGVNARLAIWHGAGWTYVETANQALTQNAWTQVVFDLNTLGIDKSLIKAYTLKNETGSAHTFYIDYVGVGETLASSTAPTSISGTTNICAGNTTRLTSVGGSSGTNSNLQWFSGSCSRAYT